MRVHRTRHLAATRTREGVPVVTLERAVVESWPLLVDDARRAPAIVAVRRRLTTPTRLRQQVADHPRLPGRRALVELLGLLDLGCQSELELWGHQELFTGPAPHTCGARCHWSWPGPARSPCGSPTAA